MANEYSKYYRTFSGTDTLVFAMFPNCTPVCLGTITTISYSLYRDKKQVNLIGRVNAGGFTKGTRTVAGTLIFTLINQHWVNELTEQISYLQNIKKIKADELPIFDIMLVCANEYGYSINGFIYGVDVTEEGQIVSIEDLFTENTCKFVARDIEFFARDKNIELITPTKDNIMYFRLSAISGRYGTQYRKTNNTLDLPEDELNNNTKTIKIQKTAFDSKKISKIQKKNNLKVTGLMDSKTLLAIDTKDSLVNDNRYLVPVYSEPKYDSDIIRYLDNYELIENYTLYNNEYIRMHDCGFVRVDDLIKKEPYTINESNKEMKISSTISEYINGDIFVTYNNLETDVSFKVSTISYYNDKKIPRSKIIKCSKGESITIDTTSIPEAYLYNTKYNCDPERIDFIVYPIGYKAIKKIIKISG